MKNKHFHCWMALPWQNLAGTTGAQAPETKLILSQIETEALTMECLTFGLNQTIDTSYNTYMV